MTAQISDFARYRDRRFDIVGASGTGLFDPREYGIQTVPPCTSCWRGFVCGYQVEGDRLLLDQLSVSVAGTAPSLFGVEPALQERERFNTRYEQFAHPVAYTGGLLLGREFIPELYVHMGFPPAWKFREVHEVVFEEGRLVSAADLSTQMEERRRGLENEPLRPDPRTGPGGIRAWIEKCFNLKC